MSTNQKATVNELMDAILSTGDMTEEEAKAELMSHGFDIKKTEVSVNARFDDMLAAAKRRKLDEAKWQREAQQSIEHFLAEVRGQDLPVAELKRQIGEFEGAVANRGKQFVSKEDLESELADLMAAKARAKK